MRFLRRALFFARQTREPAGLLKKIRLGAIDGAITLTTLEYESSNLTRRIPEGGNPPLLNRL